MSCPKSANASPILKTLLVLGSLWIWGCQPSGPSYSAETAEAERAGQQRVEDSLRRPFGGEVSSPEREKSLFRTVAPQSNSIPRAAQTPQASPSPTPAAQTTAFQQAAHVHGLEDRIHDFHLKAIPTLDDAGAVQSLRVEAIFKIQNESDSEIRTLQLVEELTRADGSDPAVVWVSGDKRFENSSITVLIQCLDTECNQTRALLTDTDAHHPEQGRAVWVTQQSFPVVALSVSQLKPNVSEEITTFVRQLEQYSQRRQVAVQLNTIGEKDDRAWIEIGGKYCLDAVISSFSRSRDTKIECHRSQWPNWIEKVTFVSEGRIQSEAWTFRVQTTDERSSFHLNFFSAVTPVDPVVENQEAASPEETVPPAKANVPAELQARIDTFNFEFDQTQEDLEAAERQREEVGQRLVDLRTSLDELEADEEEPETDEEQAELERRHTELTEQLEAAENQKREVEAEVERLRTTLSNMRTELERLQTEASQLSESRAQTEASLEEALRELTLRQNRVIELSGTLEQTEQRLEATRSRLGNAVSEAARLRAEKEELEVELQALRGELEQAQSGSAASDEEREALVERITALEAQLAEAQSGASEANAEEIASLRDQILTLRTQLDETQGQAVSSEQRVQELTEQKDQLVSELSQLREQLQEAQTNEAGTDVIESLNYQILGLESRLSSALEDLRIAQAHYESTLEQNRNEIADLQRRITEREQAIASKNEEIARLQRGQDEYTQSLEEEVERLREQLRVAEEAAAAAQRAVTDQAQTAEAQATAVAAAASPESSTETSLCHMDQNVPEIGSVRLPFQNIYMTASFRQNMGYAHRGIDFVPANESGQPLRESDQNWAIRAPITGCVTEVSNGNGYGNYIAIVGKISSQGWGTVNIGGQYQWMNPGETVTMVIGHMRGIPTVQVGRVITAGTVIGYMGSTGRSTGPHVHLESVPGWRQLDAGVSPFGQAWSENVQVDPLAIFYHFTPGFADRITGANSLSRQARTYIEALASENRTYGERL